MYEILYQVMAQNWITTNINANTFFFHQNAEQSVRKNATNMIIVASTLVLANMFFSCFIGPIRNIVLKKFILITKILIIEVNSIDLICKGVTSSKHQLNTKTFKY